jgi:predicted transcriptional regulator
VAHARKKYASQADPDLLDAIRQIAKEEGRQFQAVMEDAMRAYIERRQQETPRDHVIAHFRASVEKNRKLGELLAK